MIPIAVDVGTISYDRKYKQGTGYWSVQGKVLFYRKRRIFANEMIEF
jgi:hypothetical protein